MKNKTKNNSRENLISSDLVIKNYLLAFNIAAKFESDLIKAERVHRSIIFLFLAQLVATRDCIHSATILKKNYTLLKSIFNVDLIEFDSDFFSAESIRANYPFGQMGYAIDISHQFYLSNVISDELNATEFSSPSGFRKMRGAFYTRYEIASLIVSKTLDELSSNKIKKPRILDMGCGTGVFLSAAAHQLKEKKYSNETILNDMLHGSDIDALSGTIAKIIIQTELNIPIEEFSNTNSIKAEDIIFGDLSYPLFESRKSLDLFDAIVMNPPYDRLKADGGTVSEKKLIEKKIKFIKDSPNFRNSSSGSIDLYRLFIDKGISLLKPKGVIGAIVPLTFMADKSASAIRKDLLNAHALSELIIFPEKAKIFENVTQACSIFIANLKGEIESITITQMLNSKDALEKIIVPLSVITSTSPNYSPIPLIKESEIPLLDKLNRFPRIIEIDGIKNRRGELDLTLDKRYLEGSDNRLLKGISIGLFSTNQIFNVDYQSFINDKSGSSRAADIHSKRIAGQQISNIGASQRLKFTLVEKDHILGNSLNYFTVDEELFRKNSFSIYSLLGFLNSKVLNWRFKLTSSNNHVNNYELDDLPIPINAPKDKIEALNKIVFEICSKNVEPSEKLIINMNTIVNDCYNLTMKDFSTK